MPAVKSDADLIAEVFGVVGRFRRQLRRSAGRGLDSARLSEAQSELLWLVGRRPGISVSVAAAELGLVNRVVPATELDATVQEYVEAIRASSPLTVRMGMSLKAAIRAGGRP